MSNGSRQSGDSGIRAARDQRINQPIIEVNFPFAFKQQKHKKKRKAHTKELRRTSSTKCISSGRRTSNKKGSAMPEIYMKNNNKNSKYHKGFQPKKWTLCSVHMESESKSEQQSLKLRLRLRPASIRIRDLCDVSLRLKCRLHYKYEIMRRCSSRTMRNGNSFYRTFCPDHFAPASCVCVCVREKSLRPINYGEWDPKKTTWKGSLVQQDFRFGKYKHGVPGTRTNFKFQSWTCSCKCLRELSELVN